MSNSCWYLFRLVFILHYYIGTVLWRRVDSWMPDFPQQRLRLRVLNAPKHSGTA